MNQILCDNCGTVIPFEILGSEMIVVETTLSTSTQYRFCLTALVARSDDQEKLDEADLCVSCFAVGLANYKDSGHA